MKITRIPAPNYLEELEEPKVSSKNRELARTAPESLRKGFNWEESAEGSEFWLAVHDRLVAISMGQPLR